MMLNFSDLSIDVSEGHSVSCSTLIVFGIYTSILLVSGIFLNSLNLWIFYKAKLFTTINCFMVVLISLNLVAGILETPLIIYNSFRCM